LLTIPGGADRTDLYAALAGGVSLEEALGEYLDRVRPRKYGLGAPGTIDNLADSHILE